MYKCAHIYMGHGALANICKIYFHFYLHLSLRTYFDGVENCNYFGVLLRILGTTSLTVAYYFNFDFINVYI